MAERDVGRALVEVLRGTLDAPGLDLANILRFVPDDLAAPSKVTRTLVRIARPILVARYLAGIVAGARSTRRGSPTTRSRPRCERRSRPARLASARLTG